MLMGCAGGSTAPSAASVQPDEVIEPEEAEARAKLFRPRSERGGVATALSTPSAGTGALTSTRGMTLPEGGLNVLNPGAAGVNAAPEPDPATHLTAAQRVGIPATGTEGWTVMLGAYRGPTAVERAAATLANAKSAPATAGAFVEIRGDAIVVGLGRFESGVNAEAKRALAAAHEVAVGAERPFSMAVLVPPDAAVAAGTLPQFDLAGVRKAMGAQAQYTLQVAIFANLDPRAVIAPEDRQEFRRLAEESVTKLRAEGEAAFYYHGREKSTVTIGLFGESAAGRNEPADLTALKKRFPYNLVNGGAVKSRQGGKETLQPSILVRIPD